MTSVLPDDDQATLEVYAPESCTVADLAEGDLANFDPFYGVEQVLTRRRVKRENGVECIYLKVRWSCPWNRSGTRFLQRGAHEPVTRWISDC